MHKLLLLLLIIIYTSCVTDDYNKHPPVEIDDEIEVSLSDTAEPAYYYTNSRPNALFFNEQETLFSKLDGISKSRIDDVYYYMRVENGVDLGYYGENVSIDPNNGYILIAGGRVAKLSEDFGKTWSIIRSQDILRPILEIETENGTQTRARAESLYFSAALIHGDILILGAGGSLVVSYDKGATWHEYKPSKTIIENYDNDHLTRHTLKKLNNSYGNRIEGIFIEDNKLYACFQFQGFLEINLFSEEYNYYPIEYTMYENAPESIYCSEGFIVRKFMNGDAMIKPPFSENWITINDFSKNLITHIHDIQIKNGSIYISSSQSLFLSMDAGKSWEQLLHLNEGYIKILNIEKENIDLYVQKDLSKLPVTLPMFNTSEVFKSRNSQFSYYYSRDRGETWGEVIADSADTFKKIGDVYYNNLRSLNNVKASTDGENASIYSGDTILWSGESYCLNPENYIPRYPEIQIIDGSIFVFQDKSNKYDSKSFNNILEYNDKLELIDVLQRPLFAHLLPENASVWDRYLTDDLERTPDNINNQIFLVNDYIVINGYNKLIYRKKNEVKWQFFEIEHYHDLIFVNDRLFLLGINKFDDSQGYYKQRDFKSYEVDLENKRIIEVDYFDDLKNDRYHSVESNGELAILYHSSWFNGTNPMRIIDVVDDEVQIIDLNVEQTNFNTILNFEAGNKVTSIKLHDSRIYASYYYASKGNHLGRKVGLAFSDDRGITWENIILTIPHYNMNRFNYLEFCVDENGYLYIFIPQTSYMFKSGFYISKDQGATFKSFHINGVHSKKHPISIETRNIPDSSTSQFSGTELWVTYDDRILKYDLDFNEIFQTEDIDFMK